MTPAPPIPIIVDTREQRPWAFPLDRFTTERRGLLSGDYSLAGLEDRVAVERKSLGDLVGTVIQNWLRFRSELNRLSGFDVAIVAVEGNVKDILDHNYESQANPESVLARVAEITIDHGIPVVFWGDASTAEKMAARFLGLCWKRFKSE